MTRVRRFLRMDVTKTRHKKPRDWTTKEIALLEQLAEHGRDAVAAAIGRPVAAVVKQASRRGISLRRPGERRGRGMQRVVEPRSTAGAPLCPRCAVDPIEVEETGLCITCNRKELVARHDRELAAKSAREAEAQRELDAARQRKHRALT